MHTVNCKLAHVDSKGGCPGTVREVGAASPVDCTTRKEFNGKVAVVLAPLD